MSNKVERLQLRIDPDDKDWFDAFCQPRGGMSRHVQEHIRRLRRRNPDPRKGKKDEHPE